MTWSTRESFPLKTQNGWAFLWHAEIRKSGGKTGVDIPEGKNLVGAFYQPKAVYIDTAILVTLPLEEYLGGIAEVIKYGVNGDFEFYCFLERNLDAILELNPTIIQEMIYICCRIKAEVLLNLSRLRMRLRKFKTHR